MKIKTSELDGLALDWGVAKCEGEEPLKRLEEDLGEHGGLPYCFDLFHDIKEYHEVIDILAGRPHCSGLGAEELRRFAASVGYVIDRPVYPAYSTSWAQGGPIIERAGIETGISAGAWRAVPSRATYPNNNAPWFFGPTPLIAAMRCYVASELGDEVDVPEELLREQTK